MAHAERRFMESVDVLIVGAGISGLGTACHLVMEGADRSFVVLEARDRLGGTWDLFRYPGIRSDSDMFTFGFRFLPWKADRDIAEGGAILKYLDEAVATYGLESHIRFRHRVQALSWSSERRRWRARVDHFDERGQLDQSFDIEARFLVTGTGYYDYQRGHLPEWPGFDDFEGEVIHPQHWRQDVPLAGKRVVVIGSGATAVTLVPNLARAGARVTMLQRSPTYIFSRPGTDALARTLNRILPSKLAFALSRLRYIALSWTFLRLAKNAPGLVKRLLRGQAESALGPDFDVDTHFKPDYEPWDQRLCLIPDGDLYEALSRGEAEVVTDHIDRFESDGVVLESGKKLTADIVVPATGLRLKFLSNIRIEVDGHRLTPNDLVVYKGLMFGHMPNWVAVFGYTSASWTLKADLTSQYLLRLLRFMDRRGYEVVRPRLDPGFEAPDSMMENLRSAGYIRRGRGQLPRQGRRWPWRNTDNYALDYWALRFGRLADGVLDFQKRVTGTSRIELRGKTAVLTGAASGIGRALAFELAARGAHLALVDISSDGLAALRATLASVPVRVSIHECDMGDAEAVAPLGDEILVAHPHVDLLINNAGRAHGGLFTDSDQDEFNRILAVNLFGPINLTRALLDRLRARPVAQIVNISSIFGIVAPAGQVAYCTSKFGLRGFSEALRRELASTSVGVTTVHPGGVRTQVAQNALMPRRMQLTEAERKERLASAERYFRTSPERAAQVIVRGIERRKSRVLIGPDAWFLAMLERLSPTRNLEWIGPALLPRGR